MSVLVEFAIFPTDKTESKSKYVAKALDIIDKSGLDYQLTPMGTIIEANTLQEIFKVIDDAYMVLKQDSSRVYSVIKIDYRDGELGRLHKKKHSVEQKLGRKLNG